MGVNLPILYRGDSPGRATPFSGPAGRMPAGMRIPSKNKIATAAYTAYQLHRDTRSSRQDQNGRNKKRGELLPSPQLLRNWIIIFILFN